MSVKLPLNRLKQKERTLTRLKPLTIKVLFQISSKMKFNARKMSKKAKNKSTVKCNMKSKENWMKSLSHDMYLNKLLKSFKLLSLCCYQYIHKIAEIEERWNHRPQKNVEKYDIFLSHTFWQPWAVMVVLLNTYVAVFTVIDLPGNENFANITKSTYWTIYFLFGEKFSSGSYIPGLLRAVTKNIKVGNPTNI